MPGFGESLAENISSSGITDKKEEKMESKNQKDSGGSGGFTTGNEPAVPASLWKKRFSQQKCLKVQEE